MADNRFEAFTEKERAFIALALTLSLLDAQFGLVTGEPGEPGHVADTLTTVAGFLNEINETMGVPPINPELIGQTLWKLRNEAAGSAG